MAFRLKPGASLRHEVRRLYKRQVAAAIACLETARASPDRDVAHKARRHVKKARAVLRLVRGALGAGYVSANNRLRTAHRMLGEVADAGAVVATLDHLRQFDDVHLPTRCVDEIRLALLAQANRVQREAEFSRLSERTIHLLRVALARQRELRLKARGRLAVVPELRSAHRAARRARKAAFDVPGAERFHVWRRRVKTEWHLLRLVAGVCDRRLLDERNQLEILDECLGELHNVNLLLAAVRRHSPVSRPETARVILTLRAYRRRLIRKARILSGFYDERPAAFARRVTALWGVEAVAPPAWSGTWPRVA
jgi:CHAD domain-containing protein